MSLSDDEIDHLIKKIENINNVEIDDKMAKKMIIDAGRGTEAVMALLKDVLDDDPNTGPNDSHKVIRIL